MIQFQHHTLANGLTLIAETNPDAHTAAVGFFVKAALATKPRRSWACPTSSNT